MVENQRHGGNDAVKLVDQILAQVEDLPAVPAIAQRVLAEMNDPDFSFRNVMELVKLDPGITSHVLRLCNSPYYGLRQKVSSLEQALALLGANNIVEVVLSSKMVGMFKKPQDGYRLPRGELWQHSMATALLAQRLGEKARFTERATLFTAALLHDVGKLILSEFVGEKLDIIEAMVRDEGKSFVEAERLVLGVDHALLGALVARKWNFPESIAHAIAFHHDLERAAKHRELVRLVALANLMVLSFGVGSGAQGLAAPASAELLSEAHLKSRDLDIISLELKDILDQAGELLDLAR